MLGQESNLSVPCHPYALDWWCTKSREAGTCRASVQASAGGVSTAAAHLGQQEEARPRPGRLDLWFFI